MDTVLQEVTTPAPPSVLTVRTLALNEKSVAWDQYVLQHPQGSGYHLLQWRQVLERSFGCHTVYLCAQERYGVVRGVLPLVLLRSRLFGRFLVSMPYLNYGGLLADNTTASKLLLDAAVIAAKNLGATHIELRHATGELLPLPCKTHKVSMQLALPVRFDDLLHAFPAKLRSQTRRGIKAGMTVQLGGLDLLDDFYTVFARTMRDLGTPVQSKKFFEHILHDFPLHTKIAVVRFKRRAVAAGLVYGFKQKLEIPWAASDRRFASLAPNMLLYVTLLEYACEQGYQVFDFGRSSQDSGTYRFKAQWGAKPVQLHWYYWLNAAGALPELNPQNPKYALAIRAWQRLPVVITKAMGPWIAKQLP